MLPPLVSENLATLAGALAAVSLSLLEWLRPNVPYPLSWNWYARALGLAAAGIVLTALTGNGFEALFHGARAWPAVSAALNQRPAWLAGFCGYLGVTLVVYWWHRARHASDLLWRVFHQIHHSPNRLQAFTAFYAHPIDFMLNTVIVNLVAYAVLGLSVEGAVWAAIWTNLFDLWEHTNVRTPRWLGFIVVRPEMHRVHHESDVHAKNYGIPLWDMLFGTFENSHRQVPACGFTPEREQRLLAMLGFRDLHKS